MAIGARASIRQSTSHLRRFLASNIAKGALLSFALSMSATAAKAQVFINEVYGNTSGTDWEFIELFNAGAATVDISGWAIELWDSDAGAQYGTADAGNNTIIPTTTLLGAGGHYLFANTLAQTGFSVTANQTINNDSIENSSYTMVLRNASNSVIDSIFVKDTGASDTPNRAGSPITPSISVGPDGTNLPAGFTRTTDGAATAKLLTFSTTDATNPNYSSPTYVRPTPKNDGVTFIPGGGTLLNIGTIQGTGNSSGYVGQTVTTTGTVTKVNDNGFFIQDAGDSNPNTSDGIFIFTGTAPTVAAGDTVAVSGSVAESFSRTQIAPTSINKTGTGTVNVTQVQLPVVALTDLEKFEGMYVQVTGPGGSDLQLSEYFNLDRFGEVRLATTLFDTFTQTNAPSVAGLAAHNNMVAVNTITLDDGRSGENLHPIPLVGNPLPPANEPVTTIRRGDTFSNVIGALDYSFGNWNIDPTVDPTITPQNPRPTTAPDVGGTLQVATFNVLNFFNGNGDGTGFPTSRGAVNATDFATQTSKAVQAIRGTGADIIGLEEIENDGHTAIPSIVTLVNALNAAATGSETWAYVNTGKVGTDEIAVGFIYRADLVATVGSHAVLDSSVDPNFDSSRNRPAIAQTFMELLTGEKLTLAVNHLKSKSATGSSGLNADQGDGQGAWNHTRTLAAIALANWLANDPTNSGDDDFLILGDINAYLMEDPIQALIAAGYTDLLAHFGGNSAYSYVFDGQTGSLDHLLANLDLLSQVTGAAAWHINADEPDVYDYNTGFGKSAAYTDPGVYRTSDHDPILIGLNLGGNIVIPEPTTGLLAAAGLLMTTLRRNRRGN